MSEIATYDRYKNSGIEWIGEIPEHWDVRKLSYCFKQIGSGTTPTAGDPEYYLDGEFPWLQTGDLNDGEVWETSKAITQAALHHYSTLKIYEIDSLVIAMYGATIGKTGLLKIEACTNQACCVLANPSGVNPLFAFFWLNYIKGYVISLSYGGGQPNISQELVRNLRLHVPPLEEQKTIASYLTKKTADIDQLIAEKEQLIQLYEEEKVAIINQAVTKGLNPDASMKPSGIPWLGDIPAHWEVKKLKYIIKNLESGVSVNSIDIPVDESSFGILKTSCVSDNTFRPEENKIILNDYELSRAKVNPKAGRIIISRMNTPELVGASGYVARDYKNIFLPDRLWQTVFFDNLSLNTEWLSLTIKCKEFKNLLGILATGTSPSMKNLAQEDFLNIQIGVPAIEEQNEIVKHTKEKELILDSKISRTQKLINLLTEYRKTLISEAVTGKIKVTADE